jgi:ubiquinone/menaquinone biosynthesis C-methylase UbiE
MFLQADMFSLPFGEESFEHIFVCFMLEHLDNPVKALQYLQKILKPGGALTVIEDDYDSCYLHPDGESAVEAWHCLIRVQTQMRGNYIKGRQPYPLLQESGFGEIKEEPRMVYINPSKPGLVDVLS